MGTIYQLVEIYSSLYNITIDFEEITLYEYEFTITNKNKKIIKFLIKQKNIKNFAFYYFMFDKLLHYYKYLGNLNMEHFDVIPLDDTIESNTFVKLLKKEKFDNLTDFVDCISFYALIVDDICPICLERKNIHLSKIH